MKINRSDLAKIIAEDTGETQTTVKKVLSSLSTNVQAQVAQGNNIHFEGICTINLKGRKPRTGRNPRTGEAIAVPAKASMNIKPAKKLKESIADLDPATLPQ